MFSRESLSGGLSSLSGSTLWGTLQRTREDLELAFVLILARAGFNPVPCRDVEFYNTLVDQQAGLESRGMRELQQLGIYTGLDSPSPMTRITACQSGEQSIWLQPSQASRALSGAVSRYRATQRLRLHSSQRGAGALLGDTATPSLIVGGGALVGWAAQAVAESEVSSITTDELQRHESDVSQFLATEKSALPDYQAQATMDALNVARGRPTALPWGVTLWQGLLLAFGAGLVVAGGVWYIWSRKHAAPAAMSGSCPRARRRALVMR